MADETSPKSEAEFVAPAAVPPSREPRHDPGVIEGEAMEIHAAPPAEPAADEAAIGEPAAGPSGEELAGEEPAADASAPKIRLRTRWTGLPGLPVVAGALGALVGAALALGAAWMIDPRAAALDAATSRLAVLEGGAKTQSEANADLAKRLGAVETSEAGLAAAAAVEALDRRVAALEGAAGKDATAQAALTEARAARAEAAKALALAAGASPTTSAPAPGVAPAPSDGGALEARVGAVESQVAGLKLAAADLGALEDRLAKLEGALAAPKSQARVAAEVGENRDGAAEAILATSLNERLNAGAPFAGEWAALARLGADGGKLSTLKPFADAGAPTVAALGAAFAKIAPDVLAAATPPSDGGVIDRLLDHMRKLVRVHKVGDVAGDDAEALASRIAAALARGDLSGALDAYRRLPEAARQASADWGKAAEARLAAAAAAQSLRADAIARLAAAKN